MWDSIRELVASGVTIFLTTQYLDEADELADQIAVLDHGRIVAEGTPDELKRRIPGGHVALQFADAERCRGAVAVLERVVRRKGARAPSAERWERRRRCGTCSAVLDDAEVEVEHLSIHTPDLDDVFFAVTGHAREEASPCHDVDGLHSQRLGHDDAPQPPAPPALPVDDACCSSACRSCSCCCSSTCSEGNSAMAWVLRSPADTSGRAGYLNYVTPGILLLTVAAAVQGTAIVVAMDMTGGIIDRFRTMAIARSAVLTGHVLAA